MSEFINTVDVIGDEVMTDQIVSRTVTEYKENRITTVGQYAFNGCAALAEVDIPNVTRIYTNGFNGCSSLTTANVPALTGLYGYEFAACTKLASVKFPSVTLTDCSGYGPFSGSGVKIVDFPALTSIKGQPFYSAKSLRSVILRSSTVCVLNTAIDSVFAATSFPTNGYIYVPRALVDSYKEATNWSEIADRFQALEDYTADGTTMGEFTAGSIIYNMIMFTSSNTESFVLNSSYQTTLTPQGDNPTVTIAMNGIDVTAEVYNSETGEVSIPKVIGDVVITATSGLDSLVTLLPLNGATTGEIPKYKMNVTAGQIILIEYYITSNKGYRYDGRGCGLSYVRGGTINTNIIEQITIPKDGYIVFSDYYNGTASNGTLASSVNDRLVGRYFRICTKG